MAESGSIDPKVKKSFSRVLAGVHETLCKKLDLKRVGEQLTTGTRLKKRIRGCIKRAVKEEDKELFFAILSQKFDLKSLVFFLEVLDSTAAENYGHKEILTILCRNLEELSREDEPIEVVEQLESITSRYVGISCAEMEELSVGEVVLYHKYRVETFSFSKSKSHVQHSPTHDVTVCVEPTAFPVDVEEFDISLTVNDYAQPITMPPQYTAVYSALINLKCEPHFEKFRDYVTVTLPHCAVGGIDNLCVLSAPDGDGNLVEDLAIEIVSIDEAYVTFGTLHFSNNLVSASKKIRKQKYLKLKRRLAFLRTASLNCEPVRRMSIEGRPRSLSSPAVVESETDTQFCVLMCRPCDTSRTSHWQFAFIMMTDQITLTKEAETHASTLLHVDITELTFVEAHFTIKQDGIEFSPSSSSKDGWTITSDHTPAEIVKKHVERYWCLSHEQRKLAKPPYIIYTVTKKGVPIDTIFSISLSGSQSLRKREAIAFNVPCHLEPNPPLLQPRTIRIIRDMYTENSAIIEGLSGRLDCSTIMLAIRDSDTCILLCEISFHLHSWRNLGQHLGMEVHDVEVVKCTYENSTYFREPAYQLLRKWLESAEMPTLQKLVDGLLSVQLHLQLTTWNTLYNGISRRMEDIRTEYLGFHIQRHWKSISRLLGESEATIVDAVQHEKGLSFADPACYIIDQWKKRVIDDGPSSYAAQLRTMDVFNGLHCVHEHLREDCLKNAISLFTRTA